MIMTTVNVEAIEGFCPEEVRFMRETGCPEAVIRVMRGCIDHEECACSMSSAGLGISPSTMQKAVNWLDRHGYIEWRSSMKETMHISIQVSMELCELITTMDVYNNPLFFKPFELSAILGISVKVINSARRQGRVDGHKQLVNGEHMAELVRLPHVFCAWVEEQRTTKYEADEPLYDGKSKPRDFQRSPMQILTEGTPCLVDALCKDFDIPEVLRMHMKMYANESRYPEIIIRDLRKIIL